MNRLPNAILSSHIAGLMGREKARVAELVIEEFHAGRQGHPLRFAVTREMLRTMA